MRSERRNIFITLFLLCFVIVIFIKTMDLGRVARLVPQKVILFTLLLLLVQLMKDIFLVKAKKVKKHNKVELIRKNVIHSNEDSQSNSIEELSVHCNRGKATILWILVVPVLVFFLGIIPSAILYSFCYTRIKGHMSWLSSLILAGTLGASFYFLFDFVLDISFYRGKLLILLGM